ncbi:MAG: DUF5723 family protein, partial [Salibacter sp.]|uniref:DUF5723 family protein n=1 Tax=Salibacter sp. TaxID=2010995 RepID=UPI00286FEB8B
MHLKFLTPFFIILMTLCFFTVRAQEQIGLAQGNANVTEGVRLNPSFSADAKPWLDMHFGGGFGHFTNNYGFFSKENFNLYKFKFNTEFSTGSESPVWANGEARLTGPGFSLVSGNWSIGINSAVRVFGSARDVPVDMADNYWYDWQVDNQVGQTYTSGNFRVNGMSWMELGFNGSGIIRRRNNNMWTLGGTVKILRGINQTSFNIQQFDYSVPNDTTFQVSNMTGQYSTSPLNIFNGWGVSGDIGVTFKKMMKGIERYVPHSLDANCDHIDYHYRFGVSVLDIGYVNYTNETQVREIQNGSATWDRRMAFVN